MGNIGATATPPTAASEGQDRRPLLRGFFRLAGSFFLSEERWRARLLAGGVILLALLQIAIQIRLNRWNSDFYDALEQRDWSAFLGQMGMFAFLAGASMGTAVYQVYLKQLLQLGWRRWLTERLTARWLEGGRHYRVAFLGGIENPDQRIAENAHFATEMAVEFALGILNAALTLVSFVGILWTLSGALEIAINGATYAIPGYMVAAALLYTAVGTLMTYVVGRPIVAANLRQNMAEADFRFAAMRVRENGEAIALYRGEGDEAGRLGGFLGRVCGSVLHLMRTQRQLMWFTSAYGMVGMVYPTLVASPRYFAGVITLGGLMQITSAFGQVQGALNWFVDNFPRIAEWRSHVERLLELDRVLERADELLWPKGVRSDIEIVEAPADEEDAALEFHGLEILNPDGGVMIGRTDAVVAKGEKVLILGESGIGKSTLFRTLGGLWPLGSGRIRLPSRTRVMFMPQRPYLPLGTLRAAIAYPAPAARFSDTDFAAALVRCRLEHLLPRLDAEARWDRILSLGEQQRIAFARLVLHKPLWVFMDEATAALDEESQAAMMSLFRHELAGSSLVSIAHRQGLDVFHDRVLSLVDTVAGVRLVAVPNAAQGRERRAAAAHQPHLHPVPGPSLAARAARAVRDLAETKAGAA